jgi:flagellar motor switch protein FliN/FliY
MNQKDIDAIMDAGGMAPELTELGAGVPGNAEVPLAMLMDLTLPLSIELGRTRMTVQEILRLGRGSVVQLERLAGEPIDLYVADRRFAEGEVVVLGEHFGVRITRIISNVALPEGIA